MSLSVRNPIPDHYNLRKIVEALINELEKNNTLDSSMIKARIIERGNPESNLTKP